MILVEICVALALLIVDVVMVIALPRMARCPKGWSLPLGIRTTGDRVGEFTCEAPLGRCGERIEPRRADGTFARVQCAPREKFHARIYCTGGTHPIIVDDRTVGCQR